MVANNMAEWNAKCIGPKLFDVSLLGPSLLIIFVRECIYCSLVELSGEADWGYSMGRLHPTLTTFSTQYSALATDRKWHLPTPDAPWNPPLSHRLTISPTQWHFLTISPRKWYIFTISPIKWYILTISPRKCYILTISPRKWHILTISPTQWHILTVSPTQWHILTISINWTNLGRKAPCTGQMGPHCPILKQDGIRMMHPPICQVSRF